MNTGSGVEQTTLNSIFFPVWFLLDVAFHYRGKAQRFSNWRIQGILFEDFHAHVTSVENINLHWESDYSFKTQNDPTIDIASGFFRETPPLG